jgi:hypothetical protein
MLTTLQYTGPGSSAEWIVEAPTDQELCGQGEDPSSAGICELTPFSSPINFSNLEVTGTAGTATDLVMQQNEGSATPTVITSSSFAVSYGS